MFKFTTIKQDFKMYQTENKSDLFRFTYPKSLLLLILLDMSMSYHHCSAKKKSLFDLLIL